MQGATSAISNLQSAMKSSNGFQSALRAFARSDVVSPFQTELGGEFQSALRAFARSDRLLSHPARGIRSVSIRAPCFRTERRAVSASFNMASMFQSALRAFARSDTAKPRITVQVKSFNPRSVLSHGATQ